MQVSIISKDKPQAALLAHAFAQKGGHAVQPVQTQLQKLKSEVIVLDETVLDEIEPREVADCPFVFLMAGKRNYDKLYAWRQEADYVFFKPILPIHVVNRISLLIMERTSDLTAHDWLPLQIGACLDSLSVPKHLLGYRYILCAVEFILAQKNPMQIKMMKDIYPYVAGQMNSSGVMVDRAMRHAIEVSWHRGNVRLHRTFFGYCAYDKKGIPINAEFLYGIADHVRPLLLDTTAEQEFEERLKIIERSIVADER